MMSMASINRSCRSAMPGHAERCGEGLARFLVRASSPIRAEASSTQPACNAGQRQDALSDARALLLFRFLP